MFLGHKLYRLLLNYSSVTENQIILKYQEWNPRQAFMILIKEFVGCFPLPGLEC